LHTASQNALRMCPSEINNMSALTTDGATVLLRKKEEFQRCNDNFFGGRKCGNAGNGI
jgi:hypothetical protein